MRIQSKILSLAIIVGLALSIGCKKDKQNDPGGNGTYKVKFVGSFSAGSRISVATIAYGVNTSSVTDLSGTTWTKELTLTENDLRAFSDNKTKNISFGLQGEGKDANATGRVEIFVNDKSVKTAEGKGTVLSPNATYIFD